MRASLRAFFEVRPSLDHLAEGPASVRAHLRRVLQLLEGGDGQRARTAFEELVAGERWGYLESFAGGTLPMWGHTALDVDREALCHLAESLEDLAPVNAPARDLYKRGVPGDVSAEVRDRWVADGSPPLADWRSLDELLSMAWYQGGSYDQATEPPRQIRRLATGVDDPRRIRLVFWEWVHD